MFAWYLDERTASSEPSSVIDAESDLRTVLSSLVTATGS